MRADADLMVYVGARWPALLREAVELGCPPSQAADAVADALSRCRRDWGRASRDENVDHVVREELSQEVRRRARSSSRSGPPHADGEPSVLAPPTLENLRERERDRTRRAVRRAVTVGVPLLLVAAGATYLTTRDAEPEPHRDEIGPVPARVEENPAPGVVWHADGRLHLEHSVLEVEDLTDMTAVGSGVVYGDSTGRVVFAGDDGSRAVLGHKDPAVPVAATDETGVAAWYDPETEEVVAVQASTGNEVLRTGVDDQPQVVAVDGDVIYLDGEDGTRALLPTGPTSETSVGPGQLLDVRSRVRVFQADDTSLHVEPGLFNISFRVPGTGAVLAPDGNTVATRPPGEDDQVLVYDTRSGAELPDGLAPSDDVLAFAPRSRGTVVYVVEPADAQDGLELRTCTVGDEAACEVAAELPDSARLPVLAR